MNLERGETQIQRSRNTNKTQIFDTIADLLVPFEDQHLHNPWTVSRIMDKRPEHKLWNLEAEIFGTDANPHIGLRNEAFLSFRE